MSISPKRFFRISAIILLIVAAVVFVAAYIVTGKIETKVNAALKKAGITAKHPSVSLLKRSVELEMLEYSPTGTGPTPPHNLFINRLSVSGIHVLRLWRKHELVIDDITIEHGTIRYNKNFKPEKDTAAGNGQGNFPIRLVHINNLVLKEIDGAVMNDSVREAGGTLLNFRLRDLNIILASDTSFSVGDVQANLRNLSTSDKASLHVFSVAAVSYDSRKQRIEADSFRVLPKHSRSNFARIARIQKTRLDVTLPKVILEGLEQDRLLAARTLRVKTIRIPGPAVHAYRDKRYPFVRDWIMPLPIEGIRRLPFALQVDSILISGADIAYEEFSEKGLQESGTITFNKLSASFANLNTALEPPGNNDFCTLVADCRVMNNGLLHATFKMPLKKNVNYTAFGNVRNMDLKSLNPSLGNLSRIEISDGTLNELYFNFAYNDNRSTGEVLINYTGLKLEALKKEKKHETNKLLSAAINAILKSDKDRSVDQAKRTGIIDIERDKKRFVFQLWWKSVLDGLQSVFINNGKKNKDKKKKT